MRGGAGGEGLDGTMRNDEVSRAAKGMHNVMLSAACGIRNLHHDVSYYTIATDVSSFFFL